MMPEAFAALLPLTAKLPFPCAFAPLTLFT
jgi:hypothetical protein